ncbi:hypothetical protein D5086_031481 [Populus alba]|uniref:Uncharacterized protein n=1 Tax=Populus alba TaxID=43335 RepID=A0ACC4AIS9_POPAL
MDINEKLMNATNLQGSGKETLESFCKKAATSFLNEYSLITRFGKVTLDPPSFWPGSTADEYTKIPRHARLQNMACSSGMKSTSLFRYTEGLSEVFIAREQICLKRLGISNTQCCRTPSYKSEVKRKRSSVRLVELPKLASIKGEKKGLCVYFLSTEIPVYTLLLALGVRSDSRDASIMTIFVMLMRNVSIF